MATIDDKVVAMSFESSKFESGVNKAITSIDKLKASLKFPDAGKGLQDVSKAAQDIKLGHIGKAVDEIKGKLGALRLAAIAVFAQIAAQAVHAGVNLVKSFTIDPALGGLREYELKLNSVQTILANTQAAGTNLKDVNAALQELNEFSDKTIYNFGQMARNIGTFTAAGVALEPATDAIKGIANLAALSGSNSEQAATAMYQLSQAISAGRVSLQDWNSVVNAGMGGTVFQRALANTAVAMGKLDKSAVKLVGPMKTVSIHGHSFRQAITPRPGEESWLTSDVLTKTLAQFTGDLTDAELAAQGFNKAQIAAIQQTAKTALHAATEVKTFSQVLSVAKETAESGWAETWQFIFGDFAEAKKTFTDLSNTINGFINANADARNKVLADWKKLGGRTVLIEGIKNAFQALGNIIRPIRDAFRDIFPARTGKDLFELTVRFREFTETLKPSPQTVENLRRTFRGLFALLDIGKQIISGIFSVFRRLFGAMDGGGTSFLEITAKIGDFLVKIDKALKKGDDLTNFFNTLGDVLVVPVELLGEWIAAITGFSSGGFSKQVSGITDALNPLQKAMAAIGNVFDKVMDGLGVLGDAYQPVIEAYVDGLRQLGPAIANAVSNMNFESILAVIRVGLLGGLVLLFKNFFGKGAFTDQIFRGFAGLGRGLLGGVTGALGELQGTLKAYQTNLKAKTLKEIALAIALLAAAVVALSFVDPKKLNSAMSALTLLFAQLLGAMVILEKVSKSLGFIKMPFIAASLIGLAIAIDILVLAVLALSRLSWEELAKGLGAVVVLLGALSAASIPLSANSAGMIRASIGITAIAVALNILAVAVKIFSTMSWEELAKGLLAVDVALGVIANGVKAMPTKGLIKAGAGLIIIAVALNILALAVLSLGSMDLATLGKGLGAIGASLVIIAKAMKLMPAGKTMAAQAAGLLVLSLALNGIAVAIKLLGGMSPFEIAKGLIALGYAMGILAAGMKLMEGSAKGGAALAAAAAGLALLAPTIVLLGKQKWTTLVKGLAALGTAMGILVVAARFLPETVPAMLGLGASLLLIGAGLALAGAGVALIGVGLSAIAVAGPTALAILVTAFWNFVQSVQENGKLLVLALLEIVQAFAETAPQFVAALVQIIEALLQAIIEIAPKLIPVVTALVQTLIKVLAINQGPIIQAGFNLIIALLQGIRKNLPAVIKLVSDIIVTFLRGLSANIGRIVSAGANLLISFLRGIANNMGKIVRAGVDIIVKFLQGIANNVRRVITAGTDIIVNLVTGIGQAAERVSKAALNVVVHFIQTMAKEIPKKADQVATAVIQMINDMADVVTARTPEFIGAMANIGTAIIEGIIKGLWAKAGDLGNAIVEIAKDRIPGWAQKALGIDSPSKVFAEIGRNIMEGLALGISDTKDAQTVTEEMANSVIDIFNTIFETASPSKVMERIGKFVATGFANGLKKGTKDEIKQAFSDLTIVLAATMADARKTIAEEQKKLNKLLKEKEKDTKAINAAKRAINENTIVLNRSTAAYNALNKQIKTHRGHLLQMAKEYEKLQGQLENAKQVFQEFKAMFSELPEIITEEEGRTLTGAEQVRNWINELTGDVEDLTKFGQVLEQLRLAGVSEAVIEMLLRKGPAALPFAKALLEGGPELIASVNNLQSQLDTAATALGNTAGESLYDAGENAMTGFINGLTSKIKDLETQMGIIVDGIVKVVKRRLRISSPSRVFEDIGQLSMEGMAKGLDKSSQAVIDTAETIVNDAAEAMRTTLSDIPFDDLIDAQPVITPVLDLTAFQAGAAKVADMIPTTPVIGAVSSRQAASISTDQTTTQEESGISLGGTSFNFEQNNYSPKALTEIEIYRQTRNQLSRVRSALATT